VPGSSDLMNKIVETEIASNRSWKTFLDVGPGFGKYGKMIRSIHPDATQIMGVEAVKEYVDQFKLRDIYSEILSIDAWELIWQPDRKWDCAILGDVIEHLPKTRGVDLLNYLVMRTKRVIVIWPVDTKESPIFQGEAWGHREEGHISIWGDRDFEPFDARLFQSKEMGGAMRVALIRGFNP